MTVLLLSFLLLVLVSTATLTRIETSIGFNSRRQAQAQQNALFALNTAIGELQRFAGADQRVTATADRVAGAQPEHTKWSGVWNTTNIAATPAWLVSGVSPHPTSYAAAEIPVIGESTADSSPHVTVPLVALTDADGATIGRHAWWVGDEGVKALVSDTDRHALVSYEPYSDLAVRARLPQLSQPRVRIEPVFALTEDWYTSAKGIELREKVVIPAQLAFTENAPNAAAIRSRFHDVTTHSRGVLANTLLGGLKLDLTAIVESGDPDNDALVAFLRARPVSSASVPRFEQPATAVVSSLGFGQMRFSLRPAISAAWIQLSFTLPPSDTGGTVAVNWDVSVDLWNPYNAELALSHDLYATISTLPRLRFRDPSSGTFLATLDWNSTLAPLVIDGAIRISGLSSNGDVLESGQVKHSSLTGSGNAMSSSGPITLPPLSNYNVITDTTSSSPSAGARTEVSLFEDGNATPLTTHTVPSPGRNTTANAGGIVYAVFGYRLRFAAMGSWASNADPRQNLIASSSTTSGRPFTSLSTVSLTAPTLLDSLPARSLFDLPVQEVVSVGGLQHLEIVNRGVYSIGSSWGSQANELFDQYYLSTLPNPPSVAWSSTNGYVLPNSKLETYQPDPTMAADAFTFDGLNEATRAGRFLVRGAFNVNSTSAPAWRALIGGSRIDGADPSEQWAYVSDATGNPSYVGLQAAFFRFPHTAQNVQATYSSSPNTNEAWRQGVRELSTTQRAGIASDLATAISSMAQPFPSVAAFVNSNFLQTAINSSTINSGLNAFSPGYLSQADLLAAWAPILQARSDTFVVRAYGEVVDPLRDPDGAGPLVSAPVSRAWCEAVVQRVPDYVDSVNDPWDTGGALSATNAQFGRRFKIVQFRWLSPSDI